MASNNALTKTQQTGIAPVVANPLQALHQKYDEGRFILLAPKIHVGALPEGTALAIREVRVDSDPKNKEVYPVDGGALGLGKNALNKIAGAAGMTWISSERVDNRHHPHYCEFRVHGRVTDFDGTVRDIVANKTFDLREDAGDGGPGKDVPGMTERQLAQARKFITEHCETKAKLRAISDLLAVKRSYTREELARPFIVPKLVPDTSNPVAQRFVLAQMTGARDALWPTDRIIDAKLEPTTTEPADAPPPPAADEGGEGSPAPSSPPSEAPDLGASDPPDMDPTTGEVPPPPTAEQIKARTGAAYVEIMRVRPKFTAQAWRSLVKSATGRDSYDGLSWADLTAIEMAAHAIATGQED